MSFVDAGQQVANNLQTVQGRFKLTDAQMLIILGDMLHIWLDKLTKPEQPAEFRSKPGSGDTMKP